MSILIDVKEAKSRTIHFISGKSFQKSQIRMIWRLKRPNGNRDLMLDNLLQNLKLKLKISLTHSYSKSCNQNYYYVSDGYNNRQN